MKTSLPSELKRFHHDFNENLPDELKCRRQWVCWRYENRGDKPTKVPVNPITGKYASSNKPDTWTDFETAAAAHAEPSYDGLGFVFTKYDPFVGIDLDDCRDPQSGEIAEWALAIVDQLQSYTEITPSGKGLHIIVAGQLPSGQRRTGQIEMYDSGRYFTMTGQRLPDTPVSIEERGDELKRLHKKVFVSNGSGDSSSQKPRVSRSMHGLSGLDAQELRIPPEKLNALFRSAPRAQKTWDRERPDLKDQSASTHDLSLASLAVRMGFSDNDIKQLLYSFRKKNGLDTSKITDREDYLKTTIAKARTGIAAHNPDIEDHSDLPEIDAANQDLTSVTGLAWDALVRANDPPTLFRQSGSMVRVESGDDGEALIRPINIDRLRHRLARVASFFQIRNNRRKDAMPPLSVVRDMLATPDIPLPILTGIVYSPTFASNKKLLVNPGYQPDSLTYYQPSAGFVLPKVSDCPTSIEIERARKMIQEDLLGDFPFAGDADRAHASCLLLLPFIRDLIAGPTPLHMIDKPTPGTGASLLCEALMYPAIGSAVPVMAEGRDDDEWRKRITAKLRSGSPVVLIDNIRRKLESTSLSAAITAPIWEDRILGQTENLIVPIRCIWMATGNNPKLSEEIARRVVRIRLDAKMEKPWTRTQAQFRHPNLREWMHENRANLVWAALTLVKGWLAANCPKPLNLPNTFGSFEGWMRVLGGIMSVAKVPGFLSNMSDSYEDSDPENDNLREFVVGWWECCQEREVGVSDLVTIADNYFDLGHGNDRSKRTKLGMILHEMRDRQFGDLRVVRVARRNGAWMYKLEQLHASESQGR